MSQSVATQAATQADQHETMHEPLVRVETSSSYALPDVINTIHQRTETSERPFESYSDFDLIEKASAIASPTFRWTSYDEQAVEHTRRHIVGELETRGVDVSRFEYDITLPLTKTGDADTNGNGNGSQKVVKSDPIPVPGSPKTHKKIYKETIIQPDLRSLDVDALYGGIQLDLQTVVEHQPEEPILVMQALREVLDNRQREREHKATISSTDGQTYVEDFDVVAADEPTIEMNPIVVDLAPRPRRWRRRITAAAGALAMAFVLGKGAVSDSSPSRLTPPVPVEQAAGPGLTGEVSADGQITPTVSDQAAPATETGSASDTVTTTDTATSNAPTPASPSLPLVPVPPVGEQPAPPVVVDPAPPAPAPVPTPSSENPGQGIIPPGQQTDQISTPDASNPLVPGATDPVPGDSVGGI